MATPSTDDTFTRLTDVQFEPGKFLSPIEGYEKVSLVSLEQAIQPLISIVPDIERRAFIAVQRCSNPTDNLTTDESAAIFLYTMEWTNSVYSLLNKTLTEENRNHLVPWFSYLKLLLTALFKLPSEKCSVWRGVRGVDLTNKYPADKTIVWWRFSSSTTTVKVLQAARYLGQEGLRTMFHIECINGKVIRNHSNYQQENEVLLLPGTQFQVVSHLNAGNDLQIVHIKEIANPRFPMLQSPFPIVKSQNAVNSTQDTSPPKASLPSLTSVARPAVSEVRSTRNEDDSRPHYTPFARSVADIDPDETLHEIKARTKLFFEGDLLEAFKII